MGLLELQGVIMEGAGFDRLNSIYLCMPKHMHFS